MRPRKCYSIRINPEIEKEFKDAIKEKGLSTCLVIEALMIAWVEGTKNRPPPTGITAGRTITITQNFPRVVKRERRGNKGVIEFRPEDNCYVKNRGGFAVNAWTYVKPASKDDVNRFGHHVSCVCLDCSGQRSKLTSIL